MYVMTPTAKHAMNAHRRLALTVLDMLVTQNLRGVIPTTTYQPLGGESPTVGPRGLVLRGTNQTLSTLSTKLRLNL